jgi:2-oxoglutarate ferredoxin oxidoreductase subunit alpha
MIYWMYTATIEPTLKWLDAEVRQEAQDLAEANLAALKAGHAFGETAELFQSIPTPCPAPVAPGTYRNITGNEALASAWSPLASYRAARSSSAATRSRRHRTSCTSCPKHKNFGVMTFQAEDEIAGIGAAFGASFGGASA